ATPTCTTGTHMAGLNNSGVRIMYWSLAYCSSDMKYTATPSRNKCAAALPRRALSAPAPALTRSKPGNTRRSTQNTPAMASTAPAYSSRNKGELKTAHGVSGASRQLTTLENHLTCACAGKQSSARPAATLKAAARGAWRRCGAEAVSVIKGDGMSAVGAAPARRRSAVCLSTAFGALRITPYVQRHSYN